MRRRLHAGLVEPWLFWAMGAAVLAMLAACLLWVLVFAIDRSHAGELSPSLTWFKNSLSPGGTLVPGRRREMERGGEVIGKALACEADARFAEALQRDVEEYQYPTINLLTEHDQQVLDWLKQCLEQREPVRACVIARCTGVET